MCITSGNTDFVTQVEVVTFSAGEELSDPFVVRINDDIISEGPEEFMVMYNIKVDSIPSGATVKYLDVDATVEIVDNDGEWESDCGDLCYGHTCVHECMCTYTCSKAQMHACM